MFENKIYSQNNNISTIKSDYHFYLSNGFISIVDLRFVTKLLTHFDKQVGLLVCMCTTRVAETHLRYN